MSVTILAIASYSFSQLRSFILIAMIAIYRVPKALSIMTAVQTNI